MNSYLLPLSCNSKIERVPLNTVCDNLLRSYSNVLTKQTRGTTLLVVVCRIQRLEESGALRGNWGFLLLRTGYLMEHFFTVSESQNTPNDMSEVHKTRRPTSLFYSKSLKYSVGNRQAVCMPVCLSYR